MICSDSVFVIDDCCLSRIGDDTWTTGGGGSTVGIWMGIEGISARTGDAWVRFVTCNISC